MGQCMGKHQIPIDGRNNYDIIKQPYEPIIYNGFEITPRETVLKNDGQTIAVKMHYDGNFVPTIDLGEKLGSGTFRFEFLYFQWFEKSWRDFNYKNYSLPAELHIIFYDDECKSFEEAVKLKKTIVVIAIGLQVILLLYTYVMFQVKERRNAKCL